MLVVLNCIGSKVIFSCVPFMLIHWYRTESKFGLNTYIYILNTRIVELLLYVYLHCCAQPSPVLPFSREPNLRRSMVIIGGARAQLSIFAQETFLWEVSRS